MSKEYKTKYAIGDLVYTANVYQVDRDVIKAVKITTLKETIEYGIKRPQTDRLLGLWLNDDGYSWYKTSEIFSDKESAIARHENLKAKKEAEEAIEKERELTEKKNRLKRELYNLEHGLEDEDD